MAIDPEFQKKLQIFLVVPIVLAGGRAAYIVYERHEATKEDTKPMQEKALKAEYYVTSKALHACYLKSAPQFSEHPLWAKYRNHVTYFPYALPPLPTHFRHV